MANTVRQTAELKTNTVGKEYRRNFEVLHLLAKNRSIIITRPRGGRGVLVMDRSDYMTNMHAIIDDLHLSRRIFSVTIHLRVQISRATILLSCLNVSRELENNTENLWSVKGGSLFTYETDLTQRVAENER